MSIFDKFKKIALGNREICVKKVNKVYVVIDGMNQIAFKEIKDALQYIEKRLKE